MVRSLILPPAQFLFRFTPHRPTFRMNLENLVKDTNTPEHRIQPGTDWRKTLLLSRGVSPRAFSPAAWRRSTRSVPCFNPETTSFADTIYTAGSPDYSIRFSPVTDFNSLTLIPQKPRTSSAPSAKTPG